MSEDIYEFFWGTIVTIGIILLFRLIAEIAKRIERLIDN
jgi:hypothetical protein